MYNGRRDKWIEEKKKFNVQKKKNAKIISKSDMRLKNISSSQEIRAYIANKLALPIIVLESLEKGKKVNNRIISAARNELKKIVVYLDKKWTLKKRSKK